MEPMVGDTVYLFGDIPVKIIETMNVIMMDDRNEHDDHLYIVESELYDHPLTVPRFMFSMEPIGGQNGT